MRRLKENTSSVQTDVEVIHSGGEWRGDEKTKRIGGEGRGILREN